MKSEIKSFYYVSHAHDTLVVNFSLPLPIIWHNKGLFCIISKQKVQNILDAIKDQKNLPVLNRKQVDTFHWDDGTLIDAKVASKLL